MTNLTRNGIMASPTNFNISPEMQPGLMGFFLPILPIVLLLMLILILKDLVESVELICGLFQFATEYKCIIRI
jgi:hypothetical protein